MYDNDAYNARFGSTKATARRIGSTAAVTSPLVRATRPMYERGFCEYGMYTSGIVSGVNSFFVSATTPTIVRHGRSSRPSNDGVDSMTVLATPVNGNAR